MATPKFHIHVDAAKMPESFRQKIVRDFGLSSDPFDHSFKIGEEILPGEHFTKFVYTDLSKEEVKKQCQELSRWAQISSFKGIIQCEYIMEEKHWHNQNKNLTAPLAPFKISRRPLDISKGELYKKHELHLEIKKSPNAQGLILALQETKMEMIENAIEVTFTCSGNPKELGQIKDDLERYLDHLDGCFEGRLTYEATAYWNVHDLTLENMAPIVDQVQLLH